MTFWIGCAVWAYKGWLGGLYPRQTKPQDFLRTYSRRLTAVEGNATFYTIPAEKTLAQWRNSTPEGFRFCPKLFRDVTHQGALHPQRTLALEVIDRLRVLGDRLGPVMIQLPPSYGPDQLGDLELLLQALPSDSAVAVEVRHPNWFIQPAADQLNQLLQRHQAGRVLLDTQPIYSGSDNPQQLSERPKPRLPLQPVITAPFTIIRYISHPDLHRNQSDMARWAAQISAWLTQGQDVYLFVHCPQEAQSPAMVEAFHQALVSADAPIPPLPWHLQQEEQLSFF